MFKKRLFSLPPGFGQFDMGSFGRQRQPSAGMASPNLRAANVFMGAPTDAGLGSILMKGLGGFLSGADARQRQIAETAARQGMQNAGLGGAIETLGSMDNNYYANQMMSPLVQAQWMQQQQAEQVAQAQAAEEAKQARLFEHQRRMQQDRINAENQRWYSQQALNTVKAKRDQAREFKKIQFAQEERLRALVAPVFRRYQGSTAALTKLEKLINDPSAASDMAVVTLFFKSLDPASTVTQGEMNMIQSSGAISEAAKIALARGFNGHSLTQNQRIEIYNAAKHMNEEASEAYDIEKKRWMPIVEAYDLTPEHIFPKYKEKPLIKNEPNTNNVDNTIRNPKKLIKLLNIPQLNVF